ncbi:hypothetical protein EJB05_49676 [Eragrostis curvula]|uniref:Uncharacterized protein n=1 Tax=Eragrostis curvula TaxID=38414 RepID=A0A5J9T4V3_9POAL|nr:hypothetical protein EJB05_49676 [Eragrostis curvula]
MAMRRPRGEDDDQGDGADEHHHRHGHRRIRPALSLRDVVKRAVAAQTIQQIILELEPIIRGVVREELRNFFGQQNHTPLGSLPLRIQELDVSPPLQLVFARRLMLPIFTHNKLVDDTNNAIEIHLIDARTKYMISPASTHLGASIRLEVLVLDGDFKCEDRVGWTVDQFNAATVRAREGKRPLLVGTLNVAMNNHGVGVIDDVSFTDNSSWIRGRKFRIGVRVVPTSYFGVRIQEAVSESFMVKDHRGELYKKHYPPSLTDNVWRLTNIGKGGPIDKKLESEGVKNVQDFLKLNTIDPDKLRTLVGMSDKQFTITLDHAKTCTMGGKCYVFKSEGCDITFSPIGEVLSARIGDHTYPFHELNPQKKAHVKQLATQAYQQWDQLEEVTNSNSGMISSPCVGEVLSARIVDHTSPFHDLHPQQKIHVKQLATHAYRQWDQLEEVANSNSGQEKSESQGSMISSGSQKAVYLGTATSSAAAAMATNTSSTSDAAAAVSANHDMFWSPSMASEDSFCWQNSTNDLSCWDQVD